MDADTAARPYRSHKVPACDICRRRKIRCIVDAAHQPCRFCRERRLQCVSAASSSRLPSAVSALSSAKRPRLGVEQDASTADAASTTTTTEYPSVISASRTDSSLIMGPAVAEDIEILERYLTSSASRPYHLVPSTAGSSIVYLTLPHRRPGARPATDPGRPQREIIEQILGPFKDEVIRLYFDYLHPCLPILDEHTFSDLHHHAVQRLSSPLLCEIYAIAIHLWDRSDRLKPHPRPDAAFVWNQAVAALQDDFVAPGISTVHSALIDMMGRPIISIAGNIVNAGRTVTLAHSLGLHRDPTGWRATSHEKNIRVRLWWGVLIHDYWSSLAHGIPPNISRDRYDVPLPTASCLASVSTSEAQHMSTVSFQKLCSLTQILGDILPLVYSLNKDSDNIWKTLRKVEYALDEWESELPECLRPTLPSASCRANGSSSLWFCFLSVKLLLCRFALRASVYSSETTDDDTRRYRFAVLGESASDLITFITSLSEKQLQEFWLPYTAHLLVSATTILLRCTVETPSSETAQSYVSKLILFQNRLRAACDTQDWDLAEFCLERCGDAISKVANGFGAPDQSSEHHTISHESTIPDNTNVSPPTSNNTSTFSDAANTDPDNIFIPVDSLDFPWETLWDTLDGPFTIPI